jgi:hypothetical protein
MIARGERELAPTCFAIREANCRIAAARAPSRPLTGAPQNCFVVIDCVDYVPRTRPLNNRQLAAVS